MVTFCDNYDEIAQSWEEFLRVLNQFKPFSKSASKVFIIPRSQVDCKGARFFGGIRTHATAIPCYRLS